MKKTKLFGLDFRTRWRLIFWLTLALLLLFSVTPRGYAQSPPAISTAAPAVSGTSSEAAELPAFPYTKKFIISSYYTPLPDQQKYVTGTYERDVRLNGEGVHAADGTLVYPGIAAAPKSFPFGTKMQIPGFGIVAIHDRGGAIKGNRLDIWVGRGEEGLRRALGWGMRTLPVTVYGIDPNIKEDVSIEALPMADISRIAIRTQYFNADLAEGDSGMEVRELQRFLKKMGFLDKDVPTTGYFGEETRLAVEKFQLEEKVIDNLEDTGAGNFGPRSRVAFENLLVRKKTEVLNKLPQPPLKKGDAGETVSNLQYILKEYGFLSAASDKFDDAAFEAMLRFQMDAGLILAQTDVGAGFYGPKTKSALEGLISNSYTPEALFNPQQRPNSAAPQTEEAEPLVKVFTKTLALNDRGAAVSDLQEELARLHFFGLTPTGYFGKTTEHAVMKFQQAFNIISEEKDSGAGVIGPKTMDVLNSFVNQRMKNQKLVAKTMERKEIRDQRVEDEKSLVAGLTQAQIFANNLGYGMRGNDVEKLQYVLKRLGFFPGRLTTAYFGDITKQSLVAFQKNHFLDESGELDERTRKIINKIIEDSPQSS